MHVDPRDRLGEDWLAANDPSWQPLHDTRIGEIPYGLEIRGGQRPSDSGEKACAVCFRLFTPRESKHTICGGERCRRVQMRDYMRRYREAA